VITQCASYSSLVRMELEISNKEVTGPMVLIGKFVLLPGKSEPQIYTVEGSPLNGWFLCRQVSKLKILASILYRLEDFDRAGALFFEDLKDATEAQRNVDQRPIAEAIHTALKNRPK
jgi:hypothetical protein